MKCYMEIFLARYWRHIIFLAIIAVIIIVCLSPVPKQIREIHGLFVHTDSGIVKGRKILSFYAFFSIPYAKSPTGAYRFREPYPVCPWAGIHDSSDEGPACIQEGLTKDISEDCLTLTVYTKHRTLKNMPVYVWLHEGDLQVGSAKIENYGPHYLMQHDLVVVAVQYRLGMFGFLNLGNIDSPGNMGLADVIEALRWIQTNIQYFGGDPKRITLGGSGAGGIVVHALHISPKAQGLFQQVLISSGTALNYRFYTDDNEHMITKMKAALNMTKSSNVELAEYLKTLHPLELLNITAQIESLYSTHTAPYLYVLSRDFHKILPESPLNIMKNNRYINKPMLIGYTSDEGIQFEKYIDQLDFINKNFHMIVPWSINQSSMNDVSPKKKYLERKIRQFYFGDNEISQDTFAECVKLVTDSWFGHATDYLIRLQGHLNYSAPMYYYIFGVDGAYNAQKIKQNFTTPGASHGDDIGYIWNVNFLQNIIPNDNYSNFMRNTMVTLWANFIKTGNPALSKLIDLKLQSSNNESSLPSKMWPRVTYPDVKYLVFNNTLSIETDLYRRRLLFWQQIHGLPKL